MRMTIALLAILLPFAGAQAMDSMSKDTMSTHHDAISKHSKHAMSKPMMSKHTMSKDSMSKHDSMTKTPDPK